MGLLRGDGAFHAAMARFTRRYGWFYPMCQIRFARSIMSMEAQVSQ